MPLVQPIANQAAMCVLSGVDAIEYHNGDGSFEPAYFCRLTEKHGKAAVCLRILVDAATGKRYDCLRAVTYDRERETMTIRELTQG